MSRFFLPLLLPLSGCWLTPSEVGDKFGPDADTDADADTDVDTDIDTDTDADNPIILGIEPAYGTAAGGTEVTLSVSGVGEDPVVRFGSIPAEILSSGGDIVRIRTPGGPPGPVDVTLESGGGSATSPGAFTWWPDGTGLASAMGELAWQDYLGTYWGSADPDSGYARISFFEPADVTLAGRWAPDVDGCVTDGPAGPELIEVDAGSGITLAGGGAILSVPYAPADGEFARTFTSDS